MTDIQYTDDLTISDDADLWRRIPPWHFYYDENIAQIRPKSAAFDNDPDGSPMSVVIAAESSPEAVLAEHEGYALASFKAGLARECNQLVVRDPLPTEPAHALVVGAKSKGTRRRLAREASWVIPPPPAVAAS